MNQNNLAPDTYVNQNNLAPATAVAVLSLFLSKLFLDLNRFIDLSPFNSRIPVLRTETQRTEIELSIARYLACMALSYIQATSTFRSCCNYKILHAGLRLKIAMAETTEERYC